jgi:hypothetical protein
MLLQEAINELKAGKCMCRSSWSIDDGYLKLMPGMLYVWKIVLKPNPNAANYIFTLADLEANDWVEFALPKCEDEVVIQ